LLKWKINMKEKEDNDYKFRAQNMSRDEVDKIQKFLNGESQVSVGYHEAELIPLVGELVRLGRITVQMPDWMKEIRWLSDWNGEHVR